jgi:hypothetical protein
MIIQITNLIWVTIGRIQIRYAQDAQQGTNGHLNGRIKSGFVCLSIITPPDTKMKPGSEPIFTSWAIR